MSVYESLEARLERDRSLDGPRPVRQRLIDSARLGDVLYFAPLGAVALIDADGSGKIREFPIAERAVLGAALGATLLGRNCVVEVGALSFALVGYDMLTSCLSLFRHAWPPKQGRILLIVTGGASDTYGIQHEWGGYHALASLEMTVVALASARDLNALAEWWLETAAMDVVAVIENASPVVRRPLHPDRPRAEAAAQVVLTVGSGTVRYDREDRSASRQVELLLPLDEAYLKHVLTGITADAFVTWFAPAEIWTGAEYVADRILQSCRGRGLDGVG